VLVGLLFVSLSLHLDRKASEYEVLYCVGTQTMIDLEAAPIGWQRFILGSSQSDCTAFLLFLVTKATRLLAQALSLCVGGRLVDACPHKRPYRAGRCAARLEPRRGPRLLAHHSPAWVAPRVDSLRVARMLRCLGVERSGALIRGLGSRTVLGRSGHRDADHRGNSQHLGAAAPSTEARR
jgi:hypothetical protein